MASLTLPRISNVTLRHRVVCLVAMMLVCALKVDAQVNKECSLGALSNCTAAAFRAGLVPIGCITSNRKGDGSGCATDVCFSHATGSSCVDGDQCSPVPTGDFKCMSSQLLCWSLNETQCASRKYCAWVPVSGYCNYTVPTVAPATARALELQDDCPAIHPVVLAILIIMFVTLLIAVAIVVVVVVLNKKKQDELEREDEEAEAEAAIGRL